MRVFILFFLIIFLNGRENPFVPVYKNNYSKTINLTNINYIKEIDIIYTKHNTTQKMVVNINKYIYKPSIKIESNHKNSLNVIYLADIACVVNKNSILIKTDDKLIKQFKLPNKYVYDFKANKDFATQTKNINNLLFTIGNHKGFYRIVIKTDKKLKLTKTNKGYIIEIK